MDNKKIVIFHNYVSPTRNPLFEKLSRIYDLKLYFSKEKDSKREWISKINDLNFRHNILKNYLIGPFIINPNLIKEINETLFDAIIIGENPENAYSVIKLINLAKKEKKKIILWSERIDNEILSLRTYKDSGNLLKNFIYSLVKTTFKVYRNYVYQRSDVILCFSNSSKKLISSMKIKDGSLFRVRQIIPESLLSKPTWKSIPKEYENKKIIFHIGYLREGKGVSYLIEAFNKINRKDTLLLIAGTGDQEEKLKGIAKDNKNIIFLGYKDGVEKANYFSIADIFVFPTLHDCWGFVANESLYYGVPIISTNKAEAKELIEEGKTGLIVPDKDPNALAEAMNKLLDNPKLLKKMKENIRKIPKSKTVDINESVKTFERAIEYALKNETPKPQTSKKQNLNL